MTLYLLNVDVLNGFVKLNNGSYIGNRGEGIIRDSGSGKVKYQVNLVNQFKSHLSKKGILSK